MLWSPCWACGWFRRSFDGLPGWARCWQLCVLSSPSPLPRYLGPCLWTSGHGRAGICLALGTLFAVAYVGLLAADLAGLHLSFDRGPVTINALFVAWL